MTIEYLSLFVSWVDSFLSLPLHHLLHSWHHHFLSKWIIGSSELSPSYSSLLEGSSLNHESLIFSCSHFLFSYYESSFFLCSLFPEFAEGNHFLLAHIPWMNESHDPGRPFKLVITISTFSTSSSTTSSYSLIWETLVKYNCIVFAFWVFTFFNWFLKVIF